MNPSSVFSIASTLILPAWLLLILLPNSLLTKKLVKSGLISLVLALFYIFSLSFGASAFSSGGGFNSLEQVKLLFQNDWARLAGWVHYLAFDLLVGVKAQEELETKNRVVVGVILLGIFMFGPAGWLCSKVYRRISTK